MALYQLLAGVFRDNVNKKTYMVTRDGPPVFLEHPDELDKKYVNKFSRVHGVRLTTDAPLDAPGIAGHPAPVIRSDTPPVRPDVIPETPPPPPVEVEVPPAEPEGPLGVEMTESFPTAVRYGLRVFRRKGRIVVTTADKPEEAINGEGHVTRTSVERCIAKYAEASGIAT
jgi:hypothetical protein